MLKFGGKQGLAKTPDQAVDDRIEGFNLPENVGGDMKMKEEDV